jgi:hypothetical protein
MGDRRVAISMVISNYHANYDAALKTIVTVIHSMGRG